LKEARGMYNNGLEVLAIFRVLEKMPIHSHSKRYTSMV